MQPPPGKAFDPPDGGLGYALIRAANAWRAELGTVLAPRSVTPAQFFVLAALLHAHRHGQPAPTQKALSEQTGSDVNTTSQVIRGLERRGIVHRRPHPRDSRALELTLTEPGLALARECTREARALNRRYFAVADPEPLLQTLTRLAHESRSRRARS